jgi:hypothetical protein
MAHASVLVSSAIGVGDSDVIRFPQLAWQQLQRSRYWWHMQQQLKQRHKPHLAMYTR